MEIVVVMINIHMYSNELFAGILGERSSFSKYHTEQMIWKFTSNN